MSNKGKISAIMGAVIDITFKDGNLKNDINDRVMNGGNFFNGINASQEQNEYWSSPIKIQQGDCAI